MTCGTEVREDDPRNQRVRGREFKNPRIQEERTRIRENDKRTRMQEDDENNERTRGRESEKPRILDINNIIVVHSNPREQRERAVGEDVARGLSIYTGHLVFLGTISEFERRIYPMRKDSERTVREDSERGQ
jgi:hypothetical protein